MRLQQMKWDFGLATHPGPVKGVNEDHAFLRIASEIDGDEIVMVMIADGMGGLHRGDLASKLAVEMMKKWWDEKIPSILTFRNPFQKMEKELYLQLVEINESLLSYSRLLGVKVGTTLSFIFLYKGEYRIVHVGDSRIYHITNRRPYEQFYKNAHNSRSDTITLHFETINRMEGLHFLQLTEDHSWVRTQVKWGRLTEEEARTHTYRNVLLQCLGVDQKVEPFQLRGTYQSQDLFLLCSDGFYSVFSTGELKKVLVDHLKRNGDLQKVSQELVQLAYYLGSRDNITVALIRHKRPEVN